MITSLLISFYHLLILTQLIDFKMVWGGKLHTKTEMFQFESVSLIINIIIIVFLFFDYKKDLINKWILIVYWLLAIMFVLNTLGNSISSNFYEKIIFTPITFFSSISCFMLIKHKKRLSQIK